MTPVGAGAVWGRSSSTPALGYAFVLTSALVFGGSHVLQEVVALPTTLAGWLLGALIGPALLALVLAARSGLRATLRPEAPLLIACWMAARVTYFLGLVWFSRNHPLESLLPVAGAVVVLVLSLRIKGGVSSLLMLATLPIMCLAAVFVLNPLYFAYGIGMGSKLLWLGLDPLTGSPVFASVTIAGFATFLLLGHRAAKVVPLSTLLLWDAIACGLVMPAAILLFAIPREVWQDVGLSDVVFSAVSLALVRLLWFRGFALATLPLIATGEFTFLAAYEADTLMSFGSFSWFAAPYFGSYALLILLPLCILAAEVHQTRRNRQRMKETFE